MAEALLTVTAVRPLPAHLFVRPYVLDEEHRRRRRQERVAPGDTEALDLVLLLEIAAPVAESGAGVFTRWLPVGNVREQALAEIMTSDRMATVVEELRADFAAGPCVPEMRDPQCGPSCSPACTPTGGCAPNYG